MTTSIATEQRLCTCGCGSALTDRQPLYASTACGTKMRVREHRARERQKQAAWLRPLGASRCHCARPIPWTDPDGDYLCGKCGRARGPVSRPNWGFDEIAFLMSSNGTASVPPRSVARLMSAKKEATKASPKEPANVRRPGHHPVGVRDDEPPAVATNPWARAVFARSVRKMVVVESETLPRMAVAA